MRHLLSVAFTLFFGAAASAQTISGTIKEENGKPSSAATVSLLRAKDSSVVKFTATKADGNFQFTGIPAGSYFVSTTHIGYEKNMSSKFEFAGTDIAMPDINLTKLSAQLSTVVVSAQKPVVEIKADRMVVNVEGTVNAVGNDGLELLRKSPGVMVDKDENISLAGKNGVQVFIDGKPSPLSGTDLSAYLKSLQSTQIESIELITNPSAKYEAAGNAGIINIKLKKNKTFGTNGTVNAGYGIGTYGKYNGGFSLNHRNSKINAFGNYNYNQSLNVSNFVSYRVQGDTIFDQRNTMKNRNKGSHNFKGGLDYFLSKNATIGVILTGNISDNLSEARGPMQIIYAPTNTLSRVLVASNTNSGERKNANLNLNYRYAITGGKELNLDADYGKFRIRGNQFQPNEYFNATMSTKLFDNTYRMISPTDIGIYSFKADYEQPFKKGKLGMGGKFAYVSTDNNFQRYNVFGTNEVYDRDRSNLFKYKENINALYANFNRAYKGFTVQVGLRVENTISKGRSLGEVFDTTLQNYKAYDSSINRNYTGLFPSAAITFNKNPMKQWGLTFSRRIDRPAYQDLNPFEFKINDYTFMKGNTRLMPQYTNSFGLTYSYKYKLNFALNYSHVKDIFTQLPDTTERSKAFMTKKNLNSQDIVSLNVSYPFQYKWYSFFTNVNSYYSKYAANFGGGDRNIKLDVFAVNFYMQNSFNLGKGFKAELSGFYNSPTIWQGIFKSKEMYSVDAGLQKAVLKGNGTLRAAVSDIFHTMRWKGTSNFSGQVSTASGRWESRQFKMNFVYRFGNNQVKASRQRKSGAEEENKRTEGGGSGPGGQ